MWMSCAFKKVTDFVPLNQTQNVSNITIYSALPRWATTVTYTMVQKCVEWIILLLIEEDQNKSSANLFSGLRSGVWCDETQISYLFYHSKNTSGDFDNWTALKWYPFFFLNIYESTLCFLKKEKKNPSPVNECHARIWKETLKIFPIIYI